MPKATWNGELIAQSDDCVVVEGNQYFPRDSVDQQYLRPSDTHTFCGWKGQASYYDVVVGPEVNKDAAWYYPDPMEGAEQVEDRIAFWRGVKVDA
ncbi:MAG TPA: DUF427 domain-containing protein [Actinomycetota bacterium]|nr:DUF427 domain-containing protein [Actinomycetota bacterium]